MFGMFLPGWGMHLADVADAQGDLLPRGRRRSALDPEQLLDAEPERLGELDRQSRRRREHAVFNGVDGLAADPDPFGELGLGQALSFRAFLQTR